MTKAKQKAIKASIQAIRQKMSRKEANYRNSMARLDCEIGEIRRNCPHPANLWHHNINPAGGTGPWPDCGVCGAEVTKAHMDTYRSKK